MALDTQYDSKQVDATFIDNGELVDCAQKIYKYSDGIFFEMRRLIFPTHVKVKKAFRLNGFINDQRLEWAEYFNALGCEFKGILPSMKAAAHWGPEFLRDGHVRQEYTISSKGAIGVAIAQTVASKINGEKKRWSEILKILLGILGLDYTRVRTELVDLLRRHAEACVTVNNLDGEQPICCHNATVKSGLPQIEPVDSMVVLAQAINYMVLNEDAKGCSTCIEVLKKLGTFFHEVAMNRFPSTASSSSSSVAEVAKMSCSGRITYGAKKMRIDEDVKKDPPEHTNPNRFQFHPPHVSFVSLLKLLPNMRSLHCIQMSTCI